MIKFNEIPEIVWAEKAYADINAVVRVQVKGAGDDSLPDVSEVLVRLAVIVTAVDLLTTAEERAELGLVCAQLVNIVEEQAAIQSGVKDD
jgi:hypothetical protein